MSTTPTEAKKPGLFSGGAIAGIPVTYPAIWAAIYAVASILPAIPLVGGGTFGGQEFIVTLAGILFGTIGGAVAAGVGAIVATFVGPPLRYWVCLHFCRTWSAHLPLGW